MNKFATYVKIGILDALEMRFQLLYWLYVNMAPIIMMTYLWSHLYGQKSDIGGYTLNMMVTYYLMTRLINRIISTYAEERIAKDIKEGRLNQYITRPIDYMTYKFGERIGIRAVNLLIVVPVYLPLMLILQKYLILNFDLATIGLLSINFFLSLVLFFFLAFIIGMMAFFMVETHALNGLKDQVINVMSGYLFPLTLLPEKIQEIFSYLPFTYFYNFPMELYFERLTTEQIYQGLAVQLVWIIIFYGITKIIWRSGTRNYEGVGI